MPRRPPGRRSSAYRPPTTISREEFLQEGSDEAFREIIYAMVLGLGRLLACRERFGRALGLTGSQFAVLIGVAYRQGADGVAIRDLAAHVLLAPPHVTSEVGRLMRKGLLAKEPSPVDRRSVLVSLTAEGEAAVGRIAPLVRSTNDLLFAGIGREELEGAGTVMRQLARNSEGALHELRARRPRAGPAKGRRARAGDGG
jgi:DNA-binding MarR family transcriptional regulator